MVSWETATRAWESFFHAPTAPHAIGLFRIVWGILMLANGVLLVRDVNRFFGPDGFLSAERYRLAYGRSRFSLFHLLPDSEFSAPLILGLHLFAVASLTIGYMTRCSCLIAFLTLVSLHHRNPAVFHSGDSLMRILTLLLVFSRAGCVDSVDAWLRLGADTATWESGSPWCERLMQLQVCILYLRAAHWKLRGKRWVDGTAAYYPTQIASFQRLRLPDWMRSRALVRLATWGTVATQVSLGIGLWFEELRAPILVAGILLHLTFELFLNLQLFSAIVVTTYLLFLNPEQVDLRWLFGP